MNCCRYCKEEISNNIKHETCTNLILRKINKSENRTFFCLEMGKKCGAFEEKKEHQNGGR